MASINVSAGGVPKRPVPTAQVASLELTDHAHRDTEHHGGPARALCLFSMELIDALACEGHPIAPTLRHARRRTRRPRARPLEPCSG